MFASIAIALLLSLGIALVLLFVTKGVYPRFSPQALHILVAAFVIMGSTAAGAVALVSSKALGYVDSLEAGAKNVTGQVDAVQNQYGLDVLGISASDLADCYVEGTASFAREKLVRAKTLSIVVAIVLNALLALFLLNAGSKCRRRSSYSSGMEDTEDLDDVGSSSSFDDLDLD
jgi:predicted PurR-regulated permease PerM